MKVFEISIKCFLIKDIKMHDINEKICIFIDGVLAKYPDLLEFHNRNTYKNYCFNFFYPLEKDKIYKKNCIYSFQIRTTDERLAEVFLNDLKDRSTNEIKGLTSSIKIIPKKTINRIYSISPAIIKSDDGYWKNNMSLDDFEKRLVSNLIKKYNIITGGKLDERFQMYTSIEFKNRKPIAFEYKDKKILGDKISLIISDDAVAQKVAYMALGTGILEMNSRGAGFVNFRWV